MKNKETLLMLQGMIAALDPKIEMVLDHYAHGDVYLQVTDGDFGSVYVFVHEDGHTFNLLVDDAHDGDEMVFDCSVDELIDGPAIENGFPTLAAAQAIVDYHKVNCGLQKVNEFTRRMRDFCTAGKKLLEMYHYINTNDLTGIADEQYWLVNKLYPLDQDMDEYNFGWPARQARRILNEGVTAEVKEEIEYEWNAKVAEIRRALTEKE